MEITFWGVVGSCAGANPEISDYGMATSCVEVKAGENLIVLDCGTGAVPLGNHLRKKAPLMIHLFVTHTHWDHIQGFPYFAPSYDKQNKIYIYGEKREAFPLEKVLKKMMSPPYFPVTWDTLQAEIDFFELESEQRIDISKDCWVQTLSTFHPGGNLAYAVHSKQKKMVYLTDMDHAGMDENDILSFVKSADVLIYDGNFSQDEYISERYAGWGHSTWEKAVEISKKAGVKKLVVFHHGIHRTKTEMEFIENCLEQEENLDAVLAREGMVIHL